MLDVIEHMEVPVSDIQFASAKDAVRWAEEVALIPDLGSQLEKFLKKPGTSELTRAEARDIAQTISIITATCRPPTGFAMKCVYAGHDNRRDAEVGEQIGQSLHRQDPGGTIPLGYLVRLGIGTVRGERVRQLYGTRYPLHKLAEDVGLSKDLLARDDDWRIVRKQSIRQLRLWLEQASHQIEDELKILGWMP